MRGMEISVSMTASPWMGKLKGVAFSEDCFWSWMTPSKREILKMLTGSLSI